MTQSNIFCDMDGVLSHLFAATDPILVSCGLPPFEDDWYKQFTQDQADEIRWTVIKNKDPHIFLKAKPLKDGIKLWNYLKQYNPHILSAYQKRLTYCVDDKVDWLHKHLGLDDIERINIVSRKEKSKFAVQKDKTPNILIDDYEFNCKEFESEGGIAIHYTSYEETIKYLHGMGY